MDQPYDYPAPRPYSWKTDEFQTHNEPKGLGHAEPQNPHTSPAGVPTQSYQHAPLAYQPMQMGQPFRCPYCMSQYLPRIERRISTAGWITFGVLLASAVGFPFCWIGLLIKEDVKVCQSCNNKIPDQR